jgi:hypothetical protein
MRNSRDSSNQIVAAIAVIGIITVCFIPGILFMGALVKVLGI